MYQGKSDEAERWSQNALKVNPANYRAWYQLGLIESKTDKDAAIADYEKGVSIQENFAPLRRDLGLLYFQRQEYARAAEHLAKAIDLGLKDAPLLNFWVSLIAVPVGLPRPLQSYKEAIRLSPGLAEAHLNLGFAYARLNQPGSGHGGICHRLPPECGLLSAVTTPAD